MLRTTIFMEINERENLEERRVDLISELIFNPNDCILLKELGAILCFQKKIDKAIEVYKKVLKLEQKNSEHMAYMGYLYYEKNDFSKAIKLFDKSLDIDPESPFVHFLLGNACSRIGRIADAVRAYDIAIFLDFDIYDAHVEFGVKYERMGRFQKAIKEYITAYEIDPRDESVKEKIDFLSEKIGVKY